MELEVLFGSEASGNKPTFIAGTTVSGVVKAIRGNKRDTQVLKTDIKMQVVGILSFNSQTARFTSGSYVKEMPPVTVGANSAGPKFLSKDQSPLHPTLGKFERLIFASPVFDVVPDGTEIPQSSPVTSKTLFIRIFLLFFQF